MISKYLVPYFYFFSCALFAQVNNDTIVSQHDLEEQFQNHFYEGLKLKGIENYSKAIESFRKCMEFSPKRAVVFYELGDLYFIVKSYDRSENNLIKAIELDQNNFWYKEKLYHLYVDFQEYNKAIEAIKPLLYKNKDYEEDLVNLYTETERFEEAIEQLDFLDERYGYSTNRDRTRTEIYKLTKNSKAHLEFLNYRLNRDPKNPNNFINLIYALSQYNLKDEAFKTAKNFLVKHPKSHIAHVGLYKFYIENKQYDKAITSMKIVTESNVLEPYLKYKVLQDFMHFVKENPKYQNELLDITPSESLDVSTRSNLEWSYYYLEQNQTEKAIEFFEKTLNEFPDNVRAIKTLAQLYFQNNQYERAANFSMMQMDLFPTQIELYIIYGESLSILNRHGQALERLEMGLDFLFEESEVALSYYKLMVDIYTQLNNIKKAKAFDDKIKALQGL